MTRGMMILRWALAASLLAASWWFGNLAMGNIWAAGGPPTPHRDAYATRANILLILTVVSFALCVLVVVLNVRGHMQRAARDAGRDEKKTT